MDAFIVRVNKTARFTAWDRTRAPRTPG